MDVEDKARTKPINSNTFLFATKFEDKKAITSYRRDNKIRERKSNKILNFRSFSIDSELPTIHFQSVQIHKRK